MKKYGYFFLFGILFTSLAIVSFKDQGIVSIIWLGYEISFSVVTGIVLFLIVFLVYKYLSFLLSWISKLPSQWGSIFRNFRKSRLPQEELLNLARTSLKTHSWQDARSYLTLLLKKDPPPQVYRLLAILELEENQDSKAAMTWLEKGFMPGFEHSVPTQ